MSMTILQLSKQLDISKSGVHYYIKQLELSPSKNKSGAIILSDEECTLISDAVQSTRINNAEGVHTNMHSNVHSDAHTNNTDTQTDNKQSNESYNNTIEQYEQRIEELKQEFNNHIADLKEVHSNSVRDLKEEHNNNIENLNKQLTEKQQTIEYLTVSVTTELNGNNNNQDNTRSVINSESNQSDNTNVEDADVSDVSDNPIEESNSVDNRSIKVKKYKVYSSTDESTNEDVKEDNVKYNKRKGFFAWLFNPFKW